MNSDFGSDYITISDEDGNDYELEHLDTIEYNGCCYLAFLPADIDENSEDYGIVILKTETVEGEEMLTVPPDEELDEVYELFMERLFSEDDEPDTDR